MAIIDIADEGTNDIWAGENTKAARATLPRELWETAAGKLDLLHRAREPRDLRVPPANRFEQLQGKLEGLCSIRINKQYRIVFRFKDGNASEVEITDYH